MRSLFKKTILIAFLLVTLTVIGLTTVESASPQGELNLTFLTDGENISPMNVKDDLGFQYTHSPLLREDVEFKFWIVNGIVKEDLPEDNTFIVSTTLNLQAVYAKKDSTSHPVVFVDALGKLIEAQYVVDGEDAVEPSVLPDKPGYIHATTNKWNGSLEDVTDVRVLVLQYEKDTNETFIINGQEYDYNSVVTLEAQNPNFTHWVEDGKVVSYDPNYSFTALYDRTLVEATSGVVEPLVTLSSGLDLRNEKSTFVGRFELPEGSNLIEYGFIISKTNDGQLTYFSPNVTVVPSNQHNPFTNEFVRTFNNIDFNNIRAYAIYIDGGDIKYIYSKLYDQIPISAKFDQLDGEGVSMDADDLTSALINGGMSESLLVSVTNVDKIYAGNGQGGAYEYTSGLIKAGSSSNNGTFTITLAEEVSKIVLDIHAWTTSSTDKVTINDIEIDAPNSREKVTVLLNNPSKEIEFTFNKRAFIFGLEFYCEGEVNYDVEKPQLNGDLVYEHYIGLEVPSVMSLIPNGVLFDNIDNIDDLDILIVGFDHINWNIEGIHQLSVVVTDRAGNTDTFILELYIVDEIPQESVLLYSYDFSDGGSNNNTNYASTNLSTNVSYASDNPGGSSGTTNWIANYANLGLTYGTRLGGKLASTENGNPSANIGTKFKYSETITKVEILGATAFGTASNLSKVYLQVSSDNTNWSTISTQTFESGTLTFEGFEGQKDVYIRIVIELKASSNNTGLQFTGLKIYGSK